MKKLVFSASLIACIHASGQQTNVPDCATPVPLPDTIISAASAFKHTPSCGDYNAYIPDDATPVKYVKTRVKIVQKSTADPRNFHQDSTRHILYITNMIESINYMFANLTDHVYGGAVLNQANPRNTKVQFVLTGIDYHQEPEE